MKRNKFICFLALSLIFAFILAPAAHGNSAEPPSLRVLVQNAPYDLTISIENEAVIYEKNGRELTANTYEGRMEHIYEFYYGSADEVVLLLQSSSGSYTVTLDSQLLTSYNNYITIDYQTREVWADKSVSRQVSLTIIRVVLTLILESLIFFLFGFRRMRSWICFICVNLVTQGILNLWINGLTVWTSYDEFFALVFLLIFEILIVAVESIFMILATYEQKRSRTFVCILIANIVSYLLGGMFIMFLPI